MNENKQAITTIKSGNELFEFNGATAGFKLMEFWQWSVSDLVSNATRGRLAEFIVAKSLGIDTSKIPRDEWQAYDLKTPDGTKVEVKSAAYIQSWYQKSLSEITFSIKKSRHWDPETNQQSKESSRQADIYVYCLLFHKDKDTINPLDLDQWKFYILSKNDLESYKRSQHSITLKSLEKLTHAVGYGDLKNRVKSVCINSK